MLIALLCTLKIVDFANPDTFKKNLHDNIMLIELNSVKTKIALQTGT